jgi:hypothetical protein
MFIGGERGDVQHSFAFAPLSLDWETPDWLRVGQSMLERRKRIASKQVS